MQATVARWGENGVAWRTVLRPADGERVVVGARHGVGGVWVPREAVPSRVVVWEENALQCLVTSCVYNVVTQHYIHAAFHLVWRQIIGKHL